MGSIIVPKDEIFRPCSLYIKASNYQVSLGWSEIKIYVWDHPFSTYSKFSEKLKFLTLLIHRKLRIWSHLLKKSRMWNFIFCAVLSAGGR